MQRDVSDDEIAALVDQLDGTGPADLQAAAELCDALAASLKAAPIDQQDTSRCADLWFMRGALCQLRGEVEEAITLLQRSIDLSKQAKDQRREILGLRALAVCLENAGRSADSTQTIFEALDRASEFGEDLTLAHVSHALTVMHQTQGAHAQMLESALRNCAIAEKAGDMSLLSRVYCSVGVALARLGRAEEGFIWIDRAAALPADPGQPLIQTYLLLNRMLLLRFAGRLDEAVVLAERAAATTTTMTSVDAARLAIFIADIHLDMGNLERAEVMLDRAAPDDANHTAAHLIEYYSTAARVHEAKGDAQRALEMMHRQVELESKTRGSEAQARLVGLERRYAAELAAKTEELHHLRTVELEEKNRQLSDAIYQKEEILHVVAHDLRNPLAAAQLLGDSLLTDLQGTLDADALDRLRSISTAAVDMRRTIDTLVTTDSPSTTQSPTNVGDAVRLAVTDVAAQSGERGVAVDETIGDVDLMVDGALLRRALDDVLWNAIATTRPGSSVKVTVDASDLGAAITVSGDITFDDHFAGGRSLYIARRLIERMRGSITLSLAIDEARHVATIDLRR